MKNLSAVSMHGCVSDAWLTAVQNVCQAL